MGHFESLRASAHQINGHTAAALARCRDLPVFAGLDAHRRRSELPFDLRSPASANASSGSPACCGARSLFRWPRPTFTTPLPRSRLLGDGAASAPHPRPTAGAVFRSPHRLGAARWQLIRGRLPPFPRRPGGLWKRTGWPPARPAGASASNVQPLLASCF